MDNEEFNKILEKSRMKIAVSNFENEDKKMSKKSIMQMVATFVLVIGLTAGVVYAGVITYQSIMKEPEKVENYWTGGTGRSMEGEYAETVLTEEEIASAMSEDEAREKVDELLQKFGYSNKEIYHMHLINSSSSYDIEWYVETKDGIRITFDAKADEYFSIFTDVLSEDIEDCRCNRENAEKIGKELLKKYGYSPDDYDSIIITEDIRPAFEDKSHRWSVDFYKEYDNVKNPYECISISFILEINELRSISFENWGYENNDLIITEEEAKTIAIENDRKVEADYEIESVTSELAIVKMNGNAYIRENEYKNFYRAVEGIDYTKEDSIYYRTESRVRKAWVVVVKHKDDPAKNSLPNDAHEYFSYFIDATTGEIIGGYVYNYIEDSKSGMRP